jgi:hypothetical protein
MSGKLKIAIISLMMLGTASAALAEGYDPNLANRYPAYADPVAMAPHATFQSAPVSLRQERHHTVTGGQGNYDGQYEFNVDRSDHASSPYAGGGF